jgi:thymidine kinase
VAKLYFYFSAMNAGKTTTLLQSSHNYVERGMETLVLKPRVDEREGVGRIRSRIGLEAEAVNFGRSDDLLQIICDRGNQSRLDCGNERYVSMCRLHFKDSRGDAER